MAATMDRMEFLTRLADLIMESHKNGTLVTVSAYYSPEDYKGKHNRRQQQGQKTDHEALLREMSQEQVLYLF